MSIRKDLLLYFIECNCDEWLYEYYECNDPVFSRPKSLEFLFNHSVSGCFSLYHSADLSLHFVH